MSWQPGQTIEDMEKEAILAAMQFFHGNKTAVASALGVATRTIDNKLKKYEADKNGIQEDKQDQLENA